MFTRQLWSTAVRNRDKWHLVWFKYKTIYHGQLFIMCSIAGLKNLKVIILLKFI
jgi:hypothetical protein